MNFPVELFLLVGPVVILFILFIFFTISKYYKLWRYKPENDKGRRAEEFRRSGIGGTSNVSSPREQSLFQTADVSSPRQDSTSTGVSSPSPSKTFNPYTRFR